MNQNEEKINLLLLKLENLLLKQQDFEAEINALKREVKQLQSPEAEPFVTPTLPAVPLVSPADLPKDSVPVFTTPPVFAKPAQPSFRSQFKSENLGKSDFEKFIGENLISKIGILILVIGVAIGAKLAIDKGLISPLTRIILGYLIGAGLMAFAIKLKAKYESFSAVLLSGAIAILYFITYAAYDIYQLIPQPLTFGLMVIFTSFTVVAAIKYNKQVIALIGLVGAYAIPFLLSSGSGKVEILFSYIALINLGILVLAFKKYWKPLFYTSFGVTWLIFLGWKLFDAGEHQFKLSLLFSSIFFLTFYITNLAYKIIRQEKFALSDIIVLLLNSFIFYGIGYFSFDSSAKGSELLGLFTLANAIIHFVVSVIIYKRKLADKNLFYFILAMVITFITMAVPVQLDGNWVTIFWAVEAGILFYLGRKRNIAIYEKLSFPMVFLALFSLLQDWSVNIDMIGWNVNYVPITPFLNVGFLSSCIFIGSFMVMFIISRRPSTVENPTKLSMILAYVIPTILIGVIYYTFRQELAHHFDNLYEGTKVKISSREKALVFDYARNYDYILLKKAWIYIYTLIFATLLTYFNLKKLKNTELATSNVVINLIVILAFLTEGLYNLSELRQVYITQNDPYFVSGQINIGIRYFSLVAFALLIATCYQLSYTALFKQKFKTAFDFLLYGSILWVISSELLHWLELSGLKTGYKLGLSITWGVYALLLISIGLWKNKKHLRIGAIILFGVTLIKLFVYDISSLDTISKTIVFVSLGVLLLIISFLYNKYKHLIIDDVKTEN